MTAEATEAATETPLVTETPSDIIVLTPEVRDETLATLEPELPVKTSERGKGSRVDNDLLELYDALADRNLPLAQSLAASEDVQVAPDGQRVRVEVVAQDAGEAARLRPLIEGMGGTYVIGFDRYAEYDFPLLGLEALNSLAGEFIVRQPLEGKAQNGVALSQGVGAMGVPAYHARGFKGQGIRVGVIDVGYLGYPNSDTGCVKGGVSFDGPFSPLAASSDHGTSVAEIICDIAPLSEVYVARATTISALNAAVDWLISQNVRVINMSMRWDSYGVGDGTGIANAIVKRATDLGIFWVNAAGNSNGYTWDGAYTNMTIAANAIQWSNGDPTNITQVANFGTTPNFVLPLENCIDEYPVVYSISLRYSDWNAARDGNTASSTDLDLFLVSSDDAGATWTRRDAALGDQFSYDYLEPTEYMYYQGVGELGCKLNRRFGLVVNRFTAPSPAWMQILSDFTQLPIAIASDNASISTPADSLDVIAVAASEVQSAEGWGWSFERYPDVADYSSHGPALGAGGTDPATGISKPDISAPMNVKTTRSVTFNGTSAAAPHVAGAIAMLLSSNPTLTRAQLMEHVRPVTGSDIDFCDTNAASCFGAGVLALKPNFGFWADTTREHTHPSVVYTGIPETVSAAVVGAERWVTYTTPATLPLAERASLNTFIGSMDDYAQLEFQYAAALGVNLYYYQMPNWLGCTMDVFADGVLQATLPLQASGAVFERRNYFVNVPALNASVPVTVRLKPSAGNCGVTFDNAIPTAIDSLQENHPSLVYSGAWSRLALANNSGGFFNLASAVGASLRFTVNSPALTLVFNQRPDGGIMEVRVNGVVVKSIDTYSNSRTLTYTQMVEQIALPAGDNIVEIVATGRRNPSSLGVTINVDAVRFLDAYTLLTNTVVNANAMPTRPTRTQQMTTYTGISVLPVNGGWTRLVNALTLGGAYWNTLTPNAEILIAPTFNNPTSRRMVVSYIGAPTGGIVQVVVNGQVCDLCGTIDTYRSTTMYRAFSVFNIPDGLAVNTVGLRNTGTRNSRSIGTAFMFDRAEIVDGVFGVLSFRDVVMHDEYTLLGNTTRVGDYVAQSLPDAVFGDVYVTTARGDTQAYMEFSTNSAYVGLIVTRSLQGAKLRVEYETGGGWSQLATYDLNNTVTLARQMIAFSRPLDALVPFRVRVMPPAETAQIGTTPNFVFIDGVVALDGESINVTTLDTPNNFVFFGDTRRVELGTGWANALPAQTADSLSGANTNVMRRTNINGASLQVTMDIATGSASIVFSRQPDGGIAEVWINGVRWGEISFYSPTPLYRQFVTLPITSNNTVIEIRNTARRSLGSLGTFMYVDVIHSQDAAKVVQPITPDAQENDANITRIGSSWLAMPIVPVTVGGYSASAAQSTTLTDSALRFRVPASTFSLIRTLTTTGGQAEVWVNGVRCAECGTVSFYAPAITYRAAHTITIPPTYGSAPFTVELRNMVTRPVGSLGNQMTLDAISYDGTNPLESITYYDFDNSLSTNAPAGVIWFADWAKISVAPSVTGARTSVNNTLLSTTRTFVDTCAFVQSPIANPTVTVYRNTLAAGGIAEIRTGDWSDVSSTSSQPEPCTSCGTINSYSAVTRFNVPYTFKANIAAGEYISICNTPSRPLGSTGNTLQLDAITFSP
jgi:hypothetical protein